MEQQMITRNELSARKQVINKLAHSINLLDIFKMKMFSNEIDQLITLIYIQRLLSLRKIISFNDPRIKKPLLYRLYAFQKSHINSYTSPLYSYILQTIRLPADARALHAHAPACIPIEKYL